LIAIKKSRREHAQARANEFRGSSNAEEHDPFATLSPVFPEPGCLKDTSSIARECQDGDSIIVVRKTSGQ
jgi:hypothetical protein